MDGENLYEYWERFKKLLASCLYHGYTDHDFLLNFCGGILEEDARMIKAATQGGIEYMSVQEANALIKRLVGSSRNFGRRIKKASVAYSSRQNSNDMEDKVYFITNLVKELAKGNGNTSDVKFCGLCNYPTHPTDGCPSLLTEEGNEEMKDLGFKKFDPYSNTYNEGWKAHPNLGLRGNQNQRGPSNSSFQKPPQNQSQNSLEDMMKPLAVNQVALQANTKEFQTAMLQQNRLTDSIIGNIETQVVQILNTPTKQPTKGGSLPSHTIPPPTMEQEQAVSLRNGRDLVEAPKALKKSKPLPVVHEVEDVVEDEIEVVGEHGKASTLEQVRINEQFQKYEPQAPFPSALNDTRVMDNKTSNLYDIFHKAEIGELYCQRAMIDLGALINVLPSYLYESLKLGPLKPTCTVISLADRSNIYPKGIIEDVLVKVEDMIFHTDF
ncbi:uncharacterized protein LOC141630440 [Silene latifolia]|uniref:uncharacterized protein LOC141630440 n=1 Tax=Silene latifolia TaxID=37657 RepID=UPI003D776748